MVSFPYYSHIFRDSYGGKTSAFFRFGNEVNGSPLGPATRLGNACGVRLACRSGEILWEKNEGFEKEGGKRPAKIWGL